MNLHTAKDFHNTTKSVHWRGCQKMVYLLFVLVCPASPVTCESSYIISDPKHSDTYWTNLVFYIHSTLEMAPIAIMQTHAFFRLLKISSKLGLIHI